VGAVLNSVSGIDCRTVAAHETAIAAALLIIWVSAHLPS
jgi:hypothetical protein